MSARPFPPDVPESGSACGEGEDPVAARQRRVSAAGRSGGCPARPLLGLRQRALRPLGNFLAGRWSYLGLVNGADLRLPCGAGDGNRTRVASLED